MQCHLEGKVTIERPGRHAYDFKPGDSRSDYIPYYINAVTDFPMTTRCPRWYMSSRSTA